MPALTQPRHEKFALLLAAEKPTGEAHAMAGYAPDAANARKLARRPEIAARVSELQREQLEVEGITPQRVVSEMAAIAFCDLSGLDEEGFLAEGRRLTAQQAKAVSEFEVLVGSNGKRRLRVKIDRARALDSLARWCGMDRPVLPEAPAVQINVASPIDEFTARIEALRERLEAQPAALLLD